MTTVIFTAAGAAALIGLICRFAAMDVREHRFAPMLGLLCVIIALLLLLKSALDGNLGLAHIAGVGFTLKWLWDSWPEWAHGVPSRFCKARGS